MTQLRRTALFELHKQLGGKMVPFAGYELPVQFAGVKTEHLHCRSAGKASLFDVGHMGQLRWHGADRGRFLERVCVGDILGLKPGEGRLSLLTNANGGIIDDTVISNKGDHYYMVVNGATKAGDIAHFEEQLQGFEGDCSFEYLDTQQLLALQGPGAMAVLQSLTQGLDLSKMPFMTTADATVAGFRCGVTRCGYTGEDGFEISTAEADGPSVATALLDHEAVSPTGLGARDSLRLEAGLCLYGNDIDQETTPVEAALTWTIGGPKSRRRLEQGFLGAEKILKPDGKLRATSRKRVGLSGSKSLAREGAEIFDAAGTAKIGTVTSGSFSACLSAPISMGYVAKEHSKEGTEVVLSVRGKQSKAVVTKMPFVETRYYRVE
mmetsp:Transcript_7075/g.27116  ORF Transcript_7075/g.27116 Transcript_7075/m.27116 type:complete len:379 (-) Transcript_7075:33-1169(-)